MNFFAIHTLDLHIAQDKLNRFCAVHRVTAVERLFVAAGSASHQALARSYSGGRRVVRRVAQQGFDSLPAGVHTGDRHPRVVDGESDDRALAVKRHAQAGAHVVAAGAAMREVAQAFAVGEDGLGLACGGVRARCVGEIAVQRREWAGGFGGKNDVVFQRALACSAASRAHSVSASSARAGSVCRASQAGPT